MVLFVITQGQIIWIVGVFSLVLSPIIFFRFYDPDSKWYLFGNDNILFATIALLAVGIFLLFVGLNMDYNWIVIEVKK